ncbi:glycosyltransferase [Dehalococcoidia bacterium]|nr:glycosyltransferase [Dehalococcoidia bacterium]
MIRRIAMLSTHGYFDPVPTLGRTDTGGQVVYVLELSKGLSRKGIKVDIFTRWFDRSRSQVDPLPDSPDVRVIRIPAGPWEFIRKEDIYEVLPELAKNMTEFIKKNALNYDLFHGHYVDAGIVSLDVAKALGKPAFFTAHSLGAWKRVQMGGDPEEMERTFRFEHRISEEQRIFNSVRAQTVTTEVQKERLRTLYNFARGNIVVIPPGVDTERFRPSHDGEAGASHASSLLPDKYVLCISRIDSNKGYDFLLNAFDIVRKEIPDVHLVIGGGSPTPGQVEAGVYDMMRAIIEEKQMQDRVHLLGYVPDELMAPYYRQAQMFVVPSKFEPFGMTALEAMACGAPVVASSLGGIRDVIVEGENGLLVDPSNADELAGAMLRLLKDRRLAAEMGRVGCDLVRDRYSWKSVAERFVAFYEEYLQLESQAQK